MESKADSGQEQKYQHALKLRKEEALLEKAITSPD